MTSSLRPSASAASEAFCSAHRCACARLSPRRAADPLVFVLARFLLVTARMANPNERDIDQLNSYLKGERSAVETYDQAIEKLDDHGIRMQLQQLRESHQQRVQKLVQRISMMGGEPADDSGVWGAFAKLVEGGAKIFGQDAAIATLEEGEDHGKKDYSRDLDELTPQTRRFVQSELVPEQQRTHDALSALKKLS